MCTASRPCARPSPCSISIKMATSRRLMYCQRTAIGRTPAEHGHCYSSDGVQRGSGVSVAVMVCRREAPRGIDGHVVPEQLRPSHGVLKDVVHRLLIIKPAAATALTHKHACRLQSQCAGTAGRHVEMVSTCATQPSCLRLPIAEAAGVAQAKSAMPGTLKSKQLLHEYHRAPR